jgi:hypothetical protein
VTAADAELTQPPPDPGLVAVGADLAVSGESLLQVANCLLPVAVPVAQDAQVFHRETRPASSSGTCSFVATIGPTADSVASVL